MQVSYGNPTVNDCKMGQQRGFGEKCIASLSLEAHLSVMAGQAVIVLIPYFNQAHQWTDRQVRAYGSVASHSPPPLPIPNGPLGINYCLTVQSSYWLHLDGPCHADKSMSGTNFVCLSLCGLTHAPARPPARMLYLPDDVLDQH